MSSGYLKRSLTRSDIMDDDIDDKDDTKRKSRNLSEKKRRDQFNMLINELSSMVSTTSRKMDKSTVLKSTISFLKNHNEIAVRSRAHEIQEDWKPSFLSNEEFTHLILEALDGFIVVFSGNSGRILYVSEGVTSLLGHLPSDLLQQHSSLLDLVSDHDRPNLRRLLQNSHFAAPFPNLAQREEGDVSHYCQFLRPPALKLSSYEGNEEGNQNESFSSAEDKENQVSFTCHIQRGDSDISGEVTYELVRLVGYFRSDIDAGDLEDDGSLSGKFSQFQSDGGDGKQVFVGTGRLQTPQLIREVSVVDLSKSEFTSRHSLEWKFLFLDHRAPPIIGYLPFEVLGTSGYDYYHVDDLDQVVSCHEKLMQKGEGTSCYYRFLTKGQQWIWLQTHFYITYHQWNSKPEFIVCTHRLVSYADVLKQVKRGSGGGRGGVMKVEGVVVDGGRVQRGDEEEADSGDGQRGARDDDAEEDTDAEDSPSLPVPSVWSYKTSSEQRAGRGRASSRMVHAPDSWEQVRGAGSDSISVYSQVTSQTSSVKHTRLPHISQSGGSKCSGVESTGGESRRRQEVTEESVMCSGINSGEMLALVTSIATPKPPVALSAAENPTISSTEHHHSQMAVMPQQLVVGTGSGGREKVASSTQPPPPPPPQYLTAIPAVLTGLPLGPLYHTHASTPFHPSSSVSTVEVFHHQPTHQAVHSSAPVLQAPGPHHMQQHTPQQFLVQPAATSHQQQQAPSVAPPSHHLVMTCAQSAMQDRLQRKHAALQRLIVQQQEELRRVSEQLVMARYGLYPMEAGMVMGDSSSGGNGAASGAQHHLISSHEDSQMHTVQVPYSPGGMAAGAVSSTTVGASGGTSPSAAAAPHSPPNAMQLPFLPPSHRILLDTSRATTHQHSLVTQHQHIGSFGGLGMVHHQMAEQQLTSRCVRQGHVGGDEEELIPFQLSQRQAQLLFYSPSSPSSSTGTDATMGRGVPLSSVPSSRSHLQPLLNVPSIPPPSSPAPTPSTNLACASSSPNSSTHRSQ
ncbi:circadian locomoter output cycles protein kaput [Hetaerina americana]|uniref:circadian locomoter output cycles protein kaput n=1 Tax=Hetaerina americana TaxID=62018 RepID=UPI003A7F34B8